jgi:hypothetical protein
VPLKKGKGCGAKFKHSTLLTCRIKASLDEKGIPFIPHFFVDTSNASSEVIAGTIAKVADEVDAQYIVVAKSNKVRAPLNNTCILQCPLCPSLL